MPVLQTLPLGEALSGVFGSISITSWICLLLPQLIANYKAKSAEGLSIFFLLIWFVGDLANLTGALSTGLAPTAVALASYFCFSDLVLITQSLYYNALNARRRATRRRRRSSGANGRRASAATAPDDNDDDDDDGNNSDETAVAAPDEEEPLLVAASRRGRRSSSIGLPGSHRQPSTMARDVSHLDPLTRIITGEDETPDGNPWLHNSLSILAVYVVGTAGWIVSYRMGAWNSTASSSPEPGSGVPDSDTVTANAVFGLAMGYFSALCYLCARIPQIIKNYREKSCEGLALLFFLLSLTGNSTYGLSLVAYSQDRDYLIKTIPWLLGSLGTMVEDCIIFIQFRIYAPERRVKVDRGAADGTAA